MSRAEAGRDPPALGFFAFFAFFAVQILGARTRADVR
jgi:hypothetical protein